MNLKLQVQRDASLLTPQRCHWYLGNRNELEPLPWGQVAEVKIFHCLTHKEDLLGKNFPFQWSFVCLFSSSGFILLRNKLKPGLMAQPINLELSLGPQLVILVGESWVASLGYVARSCLNWAPWLMLGTQEADKEDHGSKPERTNSSWDPISKKTHHKKGLVEWLKV
jgi:hypothetical protein